MIAVARDQNADPLQDKFLELLPSIRSQIRFAFRLEPPERRQELTAEAIANCWVAFVRLVERGLDDTIYATPLAQFAVKQVRSGRKIGGKLNKNDVASEYSQREKRFTVERLDRYHKRKHAWLEVLVEDRKAGPAETATARIDFGNWMGTLSRKHRKIAETLAAGEATSAAAFRFRLSAGRISQLRRELYDDWRRFHGELEEEIPASVDRGAVNRRLAAFDEGMDAPNEM